MDEQTYFKQFSAWDISETEVWRSIDEFPDHYEISSAGRVRRKKNGRVLKPMVHTHCGGGLIVHLFVESVGYQRCISALMKRAFGDE